MASSLRHAVRRSHPGKVAGELDHGIVKAEQCDLPPPLAALLARAGRAPGRPPVERWNPPFCGDVDMAIAADGTWSYLGSPIRRPALVRLFASVLVREGSDYVLVTPVEKVRIKVADVPFAAVEVALEGTAGERAIVVRTNVGDVVRVGAEHPLRFAAGCGGEGFVPYVGVRRGLEARFTRATALELAELGEVRPVAGVPTFGIASGDAFFAVGPADALEGGA